MCAHLAETSYRSNLTCVCVFSNTSPRLLGGVLFFLSLRYSVWTPLGDDKRLVWRLPRIQMMFQVYGSKEQALVTVEAVKTRGSTRFNLLALDVLNR